MEKTACHDAGGGGWQRALFCFYRGSFQGNYKKLRAYLGTCSSLNELPSVCPPPRKYCSVQFPGFIPWKSLCSMRAERIVSIAEGSWGLCQACLLRSLTLDGVPGCRVGAQSSSFQNSLGPLLPGRVAPSPLPVRTLPVHPCRAQHSLREPSLQDSL